jgi:hypothetical protein
MMNDIYDLGSLICINERSLISYVQLPALQSKPREPLSQKRGKHAY